MRMMRAHRFLEEVFNGEKLAKIDQKMLRMITLFCMHTSEIQNSRNAEIGAKIAHGVRMMPKLFVFR